MILLFGAKIVPLVYLSTVAALLLARLIKLPWGAAVAIGLVVLSHWGLDFLVHRPDLEIWPGGDKVGLGWWDYATAEKTLEMGLIALTGAAWLWRRGRNDRTAWPALLFLLFLVTLQIVGEVTEPAGDSFAFARLGLVVYLLAIGAAWLADRGRNRELA